MTTLVPRRTAKGAQHIAWVTGAGVAGATRWFGIGSNFVESTEASANTTWPFAAKIRTLRVRNGTVLGAIDTVTATLRVNGASTALETVHVGSDPAKTLRSDTVDEITVAQGDLVNLQVAISVGGPNTVLSVALEVVPL